MSARAASRPRRRLFIAGRLARRPRPCSQGVHRGRLLPLRDGSPAGLGTCSRCGMLIDHTQIRRAS